MKKIILIVFASAAFLFNSCDKIESPYGIVSTVDTTSQDSIVRNILLEDFTGHTCVACPSAHAEALRLQGQFGNRLVVLSIHSGFFAKPQPHANGSFAYDFRTPVGDDITTAFGIGSTYPKGIINRTIIGGGTIDLDWPSWEPAITAQLSKVANASLKINNSFNASDSTVTSTIDIRAINALTDPVSICVFVVEDSIVNWQKDGTLDVQFYTHRHVLRGSLNGSFGQSQGTMSAGQLLSKTYSAKLMRADINPSQVYMYAILINDNTKEVIQVEEKKLIN